MTLLYLDIDGPIPAGIEARITMFCRVLRWPIEAIRMDRTRRGWHIVIGIRKRIAPASAVAAQAILGSDPMREMYNLVRVRNLRYVAPEWRRAWNVLYQSHTRRVRA
jgi:hypothetical protein